MTHEELIYEGERWLRVMEDGEDLTQWVDEAVEALMKCKCSVIPDSSTGTVTMPTEWGVQYEKTGQHAIVHWVAKDEHEARWVANDSFSIMGKVIKRTVGQWEAVE